MKEIEIVEMGTRKKIKIRVFPSDDKIMIKKRIASELESIPEYVLVMKDDETEIYVYDVFNFIKKTSMSENSSSLFSNIYDKNAEEAEDTEETEDTEEAEEAEEAEDTEETEDTEEADEAEETEDTEDVNYNDADNRKLIFILLKNFNIEDIFIIFLVYNTELENLYTQGYDVSSILEQTALENFKNVVLDDFKDNPLNDNIEYDKNKFLDKWKNRVIANVNFKEKISKNKNFVLKNDKLKSELNSVVNQLEYDDFKVEKHRIFVKIQNMPDSILEFFNDIKLNSDIPFASYKEFYKILNGFKPNSLNVTDNLQLELINENYNIQILINSNGEVTFDYPV